MSNSRPQTVLVAGGAGFIGAHLCARLLEDGYTVICVDNLLTGKRQNIEELMGGSDFHFVEHDITLPVAETLPNELGAIINLASPASPVDYQSHPLETLRVGAAGTDNLLALAEKHQARFIHASTSEVYGDPLEHPQTETYWGNANSYGPRSMYDEAKRYAEALIYSYRRARNIDTGIFRIFNTYGPKMQADDGRVVSNFIVQALRDEPLTIYGDGSQTRSFCFVTDLVDGIVRMLESQEEGPINLGNPKEFTIRELADRVLALTGSQADVVTAPLPTDDPKQRQPDITRAEERLGWEPQVELAEGLEKTIAWFREKEAA